MGFGTPHLFIGGSHNGEHRRVKPEAAMAVVPLAGTVENGSRESELYHRRTFPDAGMNSVFFVHESMSDTAAITWLQENAGA